MPIQPRYLLAPAALAGLVPLFFVDLGPWRRMFAPEFHVFGHLLLFAVLGWLFLRLPVMQRYGFLTRAALTLTAALALGTAIELIQPYFGRTAAVRDVWQNALGAAIAVVLHAPAGTRRRLLASGLGVILALELYIPITSIWDRGVARNQFPTLATFSTPFEHRRWTRGTQDDAFARTGNRSLRVDLEPARYAGTTLRRSLGDWHGFDSLAFSVYNASHDPLTVTVSVWDHHHRNNGGPYADRFNQRYQLLPGWNDIRIPLDAIRTAPAERTMALDDMAEFAVFTTNLEEPRTIYLDAVRLERD
ncbi:VanZ family protein [Aquisalimonas asiatica]|uniref:VanZ like family protein n=1 Tax=Aquisalimonas asiatica TaxID=406100 RepID=A0A1H8U6D0_9GAMM|nr:VanZ family protein [Aquisalimonas asiatica]SEO98413.1 VanZ like family protein [Aquisalimonas asiatica]